MSDNTKFAHRSKESNIENFYKIMSGEKKIITKRDEYEFEASYFAMCLLLPKDSFLKMIEFLGGIEKVKTDEDSIACLARVFNVEHRLVETRISDIISQEKEQNKENVKSKKFKRVNKKKKGVKTRNWELPLKSCHLEICSNLWCLIGLNFQ